MESDKTLINIAYETLKIFSFAYNYNVWIINLIKPYIGEKTLEVGCGIGNLTFFLQHLTNLSCLDISDFYLSHMKIDYPEIKFYKYDISDENVLALKSEKFDTIVCVNVLEHIKDDKKALKNIYEILQPGGRVILYVPALRCLYGSLDKSLQHYRRYNINAFKKILFSSGFDIETIYYTNILGILGWFVNGKVLRKKKLSNLQIILFDIIVPIIERIENFLNLPIGMSILAVAKKPKKDI